MDVTVEIDGQTVIFAHGPVKPQQLQWPGGAGLARVSFGSETSDTLPATGPWAWFRLLNQSDVRTTALTDRFTVQILQRRQERIIRGEGRKRPEPLLQCANSVHFDVRIPFDGDRSADVRRPLRQGAGGAAVE
jgi:type VI protein secretion system component VasK